MQFKRQLLIATTLIFALLQLPATASAGIIYSGNGRVRVRSGGPIHDPGNFGVNNFPGHTFQFEFEVNDEPASVLSTVPGEQIRFSGVAGSITINDITSPLTRMSAFFTDDFRSGGSLGNPATDHLSFLFDAVFNEAQIRLKVVYELAPDTFSFSGPTAPPPTFSTTPIFRFSEVGRSRQAHRYILLTSPPGIFADIPEVHTLTATSDAAAVPEPSTLALFGIGFMTFAAGYGWRRRRRLMPKRAVREGA